MHQSILEILGLRPLGSVNLPRPAWRILLGLLLVVPLPAQEAKLVPLDVLVHRDQPLEFMLFAPAGTAADYGPEMDAKWTCGEAHDSIRLVRTETDAEATAAAAGPYTILHYRSKSPVPRQCEGPTLVEMETPSGAVLRTMVSVLLGWQLQPLHEKAVVAAAMQKPAEQANAPDPSNLQKEKSTVLAKRDATHVPLIPGLKVNEPVYIAFNFQHGFHQLDARFQLSLKYQFADTYGEWRHLQAGFTTTALWDLHSYSAPFRDSTYRPSILWSYDKTDHIKFFDVPVEPTLGIEHESNGRGPDPDLPINSTNSDRLSRSMNRIFFTPRIDRLTPYGRFVFAPKIFVPFNIDKLNNGDVSKYRGYVDLYAKWYSSAEARSFVLALLARQGTDAGRHFLQLDFGVPLSRLRTGGLTTSESNGWLLFQWVYGYGVTLRDYNVRDPGTLRVGFMIVP